MTRGLPSIHCSCVLLTYIKMATYTLGKNEKRTKCLKSDSKTFQHLDVDSLSIHRSRAYRLETVSKVSRQSETRGGSFEGKDRADAFATSASSAILFVPPSSRRNVLPRKFSWRPTIRSQTSRPGKFIFSCDTFDSALCQPTGDRLS